MGDVQRLADQLKQGGVQLWNRAKRSTIQQVYGNTPQSALAAQYVGAVNTLKEEFANLANGGYAPTEDAWKLAETTKIACPSCNHDTAYFQQIQTRSADEASSIFYKCASCKSQWSER
jgi:DNA-directed RNA polymerase subunit M/transcription elongation factor TFIIS